MDSASKAEHYAAGVAVVVLAEVIPAGGGALLPHEEPVEPVAVATEMVSTNVSRWRGWGALGSASPFSILFTIHCLAAA